MEKAKKGSKLTTIHTQNVKFNGCNKSQTITNHYRPRFAHLTQRSILQPPFRYNILFLNVGTFLKIIGIFVASFIIFRNEISRHCLKFSEVSPPASHIRSGQR